MREDAVGIDIYIFFDQNRKLTLMGSVCGKFVGDLRFALLE